MTRAAATFVTEISERAGAICELQLREEDWPD